MSGSFDADTLERGSIHGGSKKFVSITGSRVSLATRYLALWQDRTAIEFREEEGF